MANTLGGFYTAETALGTIPAVTQAVYDRNLLERATPLQVFDKFGQQRPLKRRSGTGMVFRRYESLTASTAALTEGEHAAASDLTKTEVVAQILQYGNWVSVTDLLDLAGLDDTIVEATNVLGENMGEVLDLIYRNKVVTGGNFLRITQDADGSATATTFGAGARNTVKGVLTKQALDKAINVLERNKAKKFTTQIGGAAKDNTWPVAAAYWMIIHPDQTRDLYAQSFCNLVKGEDFTPVEQYANMTQVMEGEVGKYRCLRIIATTQCKIEAGAGAADAGDKRRETGGLCDVYLNPIFGRDAYGIVPLDGLNSRAIIHRAGGVSDPLNQTNTIAWKAATACVILNDAWLYRIEAASLV